MEKQRKYYELSEKQTANGGIAFIPNEYLYQFDDKMLEIDSLPFSLGLEDGELEDYLATSLRWPLMSIKLKNVFDKYKDKAPKYKWVEATIESEKGAFLAVYYALIFIEKPNFLNLEKTRLLNKENEEYDYIYPFFDYEKIKSYSFFTHPPKYVNNLIVCAELRKDILNEKFTGLAFSKADVV